MPLALNAWSNFLTTCLIIVLDEMKVIPIQNSCCILDVRGAAWDRISWAEVSLSNLCGPV